MYFVSPKYVCPVIYLCLYNIAVSGIILWMSPANGRLSLVGRIHKMIPAVRNIVWCDKNFFKKGFPLIHWSIEDAAVILN